MTITAISANKNKNVVTLLVDGVQSPKPGVGSAKVSAADTNDPLYIGGLPGKTDLSILSGQTVSPRLSQACRLADQNT